MTAGNNHFGKLDVCFHSQRVAGEARVKNSLSCPFGGVHRKIRSGGRRRSKEVVSQHRDRQPAIGGYGKNKGDAALLASAEKSCVPFVFHKSCRTSRCTATGAAFFFRATPRRCGGPGG